MAQHPPEWLERLLSLLTPPACREYVLGDLHERFRSFWQYVLDALRAIPMVVLGRARRTADPVMLLMESLAAYVSFVCAAQWLDQTMLSSDFGLARLGIPVAAMLLGLMLADVYSDPARRYAWKPAMGPLAAFVCAFLPRAAPLPVALAGGAMSALLWTAVRVVFGGSAWTPAIKAGAHWRKQTLAPVREWAWYVLAAAVAAIFLLAARHR